MGDEVKILMGIYFTLVPFSQGNLGGSAWPQYPFWGAFCALRLWRWGSLELPMPKEAGAA
jgi:hypothetical protein